MSDSLQPQLCLVWIAAYQAPLSFTTSQSLLKLMSIESVMSSNHFILCHPLLLLPSIFPSIRVFSNESALHIREPNYRGFSSSIIPSSEYLRLTGLISLISRGLSRVFSQHHNSKASILQPSAIRRQLKEFYPETRSSKQGPGDDEGMTLSYQEAEFREQGPS